MLKVLVAAQTAAKLAIECDAVADCKDTADWKALEAQLLEALAAIRPILQEIRK